MEQTHFARYKPLLADWEAFVSAVKRPLPNTIWANPFKQPPDQFAAFMSRNGIRLEPLSWLPGGFKLPDGVSPGLRWEYLAGLFHVQEEVSMLPVHLLDLQPTDRVLDMCAAPGNKTVQMGVMMNNQGTIIAVDRHGGRMRAARQVFNRLGVVNVTAVSHDAGNLPKSVGLFDKVLADVPCTCEGTCRKDPSIVNRLTDSAHERMARKQTAILRKAVQLCRPGGRIVYSTCTFAPEENECVVAAVLREHAGRIRLLPASIPGFAASPGITRWRDQELDSTLALTRRVWPQQQDTGGFFMALLERLPDDGGEVYEFSRETAAQMFAPMIEPDPWFEQITTRFGIPTAVFANFDLLRWSKRGVWLINSDHRPLKQPQPDSVGMIFVRPKGKYPKLTTAGALLFGRHASRNLIDLEPEQMMAFYGREEFPISSSQLMANSGSGYLLARFQGFPIGIGIYRQAKGTVESTFPKGWARRHIQF